MASKAPHLLLQAFSRLPPGRASLHVYGSIAAYHGDDSYRQLVEPLLAQPGVQRHGAVPHDQLPCALASLDVIVVPSVWLENAPFVVLEAALAGVPVVASDLGGMRESVRHGESGLLFPPGDAGALAAALQRLIDEPDLLPRLRSGLRTPLSIEADAAQLRPIYRELIEVRRPQQAKLAAVVLNYRTLASAVACVESLQRGSLAPGALLVVDNDSGDGSTSFLRARLGPARVLSSERNRGFAGGVNAGIERALRQGAERVLVVNGDLRVEARTVARLAQALDADPSLGIVGPVLVSAAAPDRVDTDGISFDARTGRMLHRGFGTAWLPRAGVRQVDAVSGACMLITRRMLEQVGLFAEEYFFTFEDLDLCLRARAAGFGVACVDDAIAFHEGGASLATRASRRSYFAVRNHLMLAREHAPGGPFSRAARAAAIVALNAAHVALRGERPRTAGLLAMARGVTDYLRGRSGPD